MRTPSVQPVLAVLALCVAACQLPDQLPAQEQQPRLAKVRAALISEVRGDVAIDTGTGLQHAFAHVPLREGDRLQTGTGRAEVEFEDNSTLRLVPYTTVEFPRLSLLPGGARATTVRIVKGTAYISIVPSYIVDPHGSDFIVTFSQRRLHLRPSDHIRLELPAPNGEPALARLAVFDGTGQIESPSGTTNFARKKTYTFSLNAQSTPGVAARIKTLPSDRWDGWSAAYHNRTAGRPHSLKDTRSGLLHDIF